MTWQTGHRPMRLSLLAFLVAALLAPAGRSEAQVLYGSLVGNVADSTKAPVPGATVTIIHKGTNLAREATTRSDGSFNFANVQPGSYTIRVVLAGFKEAVRENVPVSANAVARVELGLEVGQLTEAVTVESAHALLQTDTGSVNAELKSKEITTLPLGNYRNYQTLLNLVPGTTPAAFQNAITDTPARSLTTNVNGTARNSNNTKLDGAVTVFVWLPHHAVYVAPAETVDTVNVSTSNFDAEQGMAGGAAVTVLTKSGTNEFHGTGSWLHEDDSLRARNWANPGEKPNTSRNIGSVTLGGPIIKNKLFFFGAWEGPVQQGPQHQDGDPPHGGHAQRATSARSGPPSTTPPPETPTAAAALPSPTTSSPPTGSARSRSSSSRGFPTPTDRAPTATTPTRGSWTSPATTSTRRSTSTSPLPASSGRSTAR